MLARSRMKDVRLMDTWCGALPNAKGQKWGGMMAEPLGCAGMVGVWPSLYWPRAQLRLAQSPGGCWDALSQCVGQNSTSNGSIWKGVMEQIRVRVIRAGWGVNYWRLGKGRWWSTGGVLQEIYYKWCTTGDLLQVVYYRWWFNYRWCTSDVLVVF